MPTWLTVAIWIIMICWTFIEVWAFKLLSDELYIAKRQHRLPRKYTSKGSFFSIMWFILMTMWVCFQVFG